MVFETQNMIMDINKAIYMGIFNVQSKTVQQSNASHMHTVVET